MTRPSKRTLSAVAALGALCLGVTLPDGLEWPAQAALLAFGGAAVFWTLTDLSGAYVAVAAALFLVAVRGSSSRR